MAASLAFKRLFSSNIFPKSYFGSTSPIASVSSSSRFFNTNAVRNYEDDVGVDDRRVDVDRRSARSVSRLRNEDFLSDVFDPFLPTRSLSQVLNLMDQFTGSSGSNSVGTGLRRGWEARETDDALHLRIDMPGLGKEDVKVSVEHNTLTIKGEGGKEEGDEESGRRYSSRIDLPERLYKIDQVNAVMKNGVLKVVVPKMKEDERKDVLSVKVQ